MKALRSAAVQAIVLLVVGTAIAMGANLLRTKDQIKIFRDYNPKMVFPPPNGAATNHGPASAPENSTPASPTTAPTEPVSRPTSVVPTPAANNPTTAAATEPAPTSQPTGPTPEQPFQLVTVQQAVDLFEDPKTSAGAYVFVDARADDPYSAGHIPGAVQCDFYRIEQDLPTVLAYVSGAEKVVVYCNGGTCEDSQHVCIELLNSSVPWDRLFLFHGGWEEWTKNNLPVQTGKEK